MENFLINPPALWPRPQGAVRADCGLRVVAIREARDDSKGARVEEAMALDVREDGNYVGVTMKILVPLFALAALLHPALAAGPADFLGIWTGTQTSTLNHKKEKAEAKIFFRKASGDLVFIEEAVVKSGKIPSRTQTKFGGTSEGGKFGSTTKRKGKVVEEAGGNWFVADRTLTVYPYSSRRYGTITMKIAKSGRGFTLSESYSDGTKVTGRFVRQ